MEQLNINTVNDYEGLRKALNGELNASAVHFCRIGYLLKRARDERNMLEGSSYSSVNEFANAEFGLDASQVSRFIRINDRFSIGGYSEHLKTEYEAYGSAKLSLMLMLPDAINEELSPDMSKSEINTVKTEYEEEQKISDLEVMMEDTTGVPDEFIMAVVHELNDENPEVARFFHQTMELAKKLGVEASEADIKEAYAPEGIMTYVIRIPGQGRFMVSMKNEGITITNVRDSETKSPLTWPEFMQVVIEDIKDREFPDEERKPEKKTEKRKPEKVKPAKIKKPEPKKEEIAPVQEENDQKPAENDQKSTENDQKPTENDQKPAEIIRNESESVLEETSGAAGVEEVEIEEVNPQQKLIKEISDSIRNLEEQIRARNWTRAFIYVEDIEFRIKRVKEIWGENQ